MNRKKYFWITIFLIHLFFFIYQVYKSNLYLSDSYEYLNAAQNILKYGELYCGDFENIDYDLYTKRPPLYPLFIIFTSLLLNSHLSIIFFQCLLSILTIFFVIKISKLLYGHNNILLLIMLILLFTPSQFIYSNLLMSEILLQNLITWTVFFFFLFVKTQKYKYLMLCNIIIILCALTKPIFYIFPALNLIISIIHYLKSKNIINVAISMLSVMGIIIYMGWNYYRTGYFHFSSIQNINLLNYTAYHFAMKNHNSQYADSLVNDIITKSNSFNKYSEKNIFIQNKSINYLSDNIYSYSLFHIQGIINFFVDPGRFDLYTFFNIDSSNNNSMLHAYSEHGYKGIWLYIREQPVLFVIYFFLILIFNIFKTLSILFIFLNKKIDIFVRVFIIAIVFYIAFFTGPIGASRFALPIFPLLLISTISVYDYVHTKILNPSK